MGPPGATRVTNHQSRAQCTITNAVKTAATGTAMIAASLRQAMATVATVSDEQRHHGERRMGGGHRPA